MPAHRELILLTLNLFLFLIQPGVRAERAGVCQCAVHGSLVHLCEVDSSDSATDRRRRRASLIRRTRSHGQAARPIRQPANHTPVGRESTNFIVAFPSFHRGEHLLLLRTYRERFPLQTTPSREPHFSALRFRRLPVSRTGSPRHRHCGGAKPERGAATADRRRIPLLCTRGALSISFDLSVAPRTSLAAHVPLSARSALRVRRSIRRFD